jgi:uncharacterized protein involved in outer membrane biogenesis
MKKIIRRIAYVLLTLIILGVIGIFALPVLLKPQLERSASELLKREVVLGDLKINPFLFKVELQNLQIKDQYGEFLTSRSVLVDFELMSVLRGGPVLRELTLREPKLQLIRLSEDQFNFSDLLQSDPAADPNAEPARFALNNIRIIDGQFALDDRVRQVQQRVDQLQLALPFVSNMEQRIDEYIEPVLAGRLNGKAFALKAQSKPFKDSQDTSLRFSSKDLDITDYVRYAPLPQALKLAQGRLDLDLEVVFRQEKNRALVLFNGNTQVRDLRVKVLEQDALQLGRMALDFKDFKPLLGDFHFKKIALDQLQVSAERNAQGQINWLALHAAQATPSQRKIASAVSRERAKFEQRSVFTVDQVEIKNGRLSWKDQQVRPEFSQSLTDITLSGSNWSTAATKPFPIVLSAKTSQGAQLNLDVRLNTTPLQLTGAAQLSAMQLADFATYYSPWLAADLRGQLSSQLQFAYQAQAQQFQIKSGAAKLAQFALTLPKQRKPAIALGKVELADVEVDSASQLINIARLASQQGQIDLQLLPENKLNLQAMLPQKIAASSAKPAQSATPWRVKLAEFELDQYAVRFEDRQLAQPAPVQLKQIALKINDLDTQAGAKANLNFSAKAGRATQMSVSGPFVPQPFSAQWQINARGIDAAYMQPYFSRYLNISLASGFVDAKGRLNLNTAPKFSGSYAGDLGIRQFYALDKSSGEDFLKWKNLSLKGLKTDFVPLKIDIADIGLDQFYSRLILSPNGRMNVQDIVVGEGGATSVTRESTQVVSKASINASKVAAVAVADPTPPIPIRIGKIVLSQGNIRYSDLLIQPNYTANLTNMGGQISGLSSQNDTRAQLALAGSVDNIAPVQIQGSLNPLAKEPFFDLKGGVKGYELTAASTYAEKYAGYGIAKGKLSMDVAYFIENQQLKASNQLFLDQLTLSDEPSNSPDATKLPVKFALSLLTDRRGQIKLNLPIEGSLNDPKFKIGGVIWQVIGNVLEKIITAPFDALAGGLSDGPSLSYVTFEPGSARINEAAQAAIARVGTLLEDRPALKLEMSAWADAAVDGAGLKERMLRQKMRAIKAKQLGMAAESIESETALQLSDAEIPALIAAVYQQSKFEKPSNLLGLNKKLPAEEIKALILQHLVVDEEALAQLASRRAKNVDQALTAAGLANERIFTLKPVLNPAASLLEQDKGPASRVQFTLK